ncbi:AraC family transcriptional regulator [Maribacter sp.]|nr:AraC family transcriptional regulator [Maribacter sp.]
MLILNNGEYNGKIVQSAQIDHATVSNTLYASQSERPEWHYHENLHICFVFDEGRAETRHQTTYSEKEGGLFFYHSEEQHRWASPGPISKSANIEIAAAFLKKYQLDENDIKEAIKTNAGAKALIIKMQKELHSPDQNNYLNLQTLLLELVSYQQQKTYRNKPRWAILLKQLLHDHWNEILSLQEISITVGAHPVTISKHFRKFFGCTLGEYQRTLKIEKSIGFIKNTPLALSQIAFSCGFTDQSHFIRNFKQHTGFLPKDFRKF